MRHAPRKTTRRAAALSGEARRSALTIRIDFGAFGYLGPGKIALMELISKHGSISAAGKEMGMSYRRAWLLVDAMNRLFREPVVSAAAGGKAGGGAQLTALGERVVQAYAEIELAASRAAGPTLESLERLTS